MARASVFIIIQYSPPPVLGGVVEDRGGIKSKKILQILQIYIDINLCNLWATNKSRAKFI